MAEAPPVDAGDSGRVVLTNLNNRVMPIMRYDMRDMVTRGFLEDKEPFEPIQSIDGRANDALSIRSATGGFDTIHTLVLSEFFVPGLKQFHFVGKSPEEIIIRYNASEAMDENVRQAFQKILQLKGAVSTVCVFATYVSKLPVDEKTGKFRLVMVE